MRRIVTASLAVLFMGCCAQAASAKVLLVGTYHGSKGQYKTIQAAVNAAKPGDWILVAPGDYKTKSFKTVPGSKDFPAGVVITKKNLTLRGMNRNTVIVDGTKSGAPCSKKASAQNYGPKTEGGGAGLNGIMVWKANNVSIENLTACNFLGGTGGDGGTGNEIWWNGGAETGKIGGWGFYGSYLNATSYFYNNENTAAEYGIFSSNWDGGTWDKTYTSNFNDSGYYIGACQQECNQTINHAWAEYNALGYSGSNSGGKLIIENGEWDNNVDGINTNSQNGDDPAPQNGDCPNNGTSPITHTHSCWVVINNDVHNNNDPNVPQAGSAAAGPVGTGIVVAGGRNDTVMKNKIVNNDGWGVWFVFYPDSGPPCTGGTLAGSSCTFDDWGNALVDNQFGDNGSYGHPSNGDFQDVTLSSGHPANCFHGNTEIGGGSVKPATAAALQTTNGTCSSAPSTAGSSDPNFVIEGICDSQIQIVAGQAPPCPTGPYPVQTKVVMHPLPAASKLPTMPNPCNGAPINAWCPRRAGAHPS
jgi:hypothetical protein